MTDKELFEKVSKKFNLNENTNISNVFDKGNFNKTILEIRKSSAPTGGGAFGNAFNAVRAMIPGTRAYDMRSAERDTAVAQARQEQLKAKKQQQELKGRGNKQGQSKMSPATEKFYRSNPQFKNAYDTAAAGKELTAQQQKIYNAIMKKVQDIESGKISQTASAEAKEKMIERGSQLRLQKLSKACPNLGKFLLNPKNKNIKDQYIRFVLHDEDTLGLLKQEEVVILAKGLEKILTANPSEINNFKAIVRREPQLPDDGKFFIGSLPKAPDGRKKQTGVKEPKLSDLKPANVDYFIKKDAIAKGRSITAQKQEMARQATDRYTAGNVVQGNRGGVFEISSINKENGLITVYTVSAKERRTQYKFAYQLGDIVERGTQQKDLGLESFQKIVKRYR